MSATAEHLTDQPPDGVAAASVKGQTRPSTQYPKHALEESLRVSQTIEDTNGGQPLPPIDIAEILRISPGSSRFQMILSASLRYGLTTGNYKSDQIVIAGLGSEIVSPISDEARAAALARAALSPPTFRTAYEHFKGKKLPAGEFLTNTFAREFGVPKEDAERCAAIFRTNMEFVGLIKKMPTGDWLGTEPQTSVGTATVTDDFDAEESMESSSGAVPAPEGPTTPTPPALVLASATPEPDNPKAIFIGHGSDKTALNQLVKILNELGLPHKVAEYETNAGRPISQKVADTMNECGAAILLFTADRELQDKEGSPVWLSSHNVAHELGAAYVQYKGRVVIFKEVGVDLASNYQGIGFIEFEKGKLADKAMELFREIRQFGLIKISIGD